MSQLLDENSNWFAPISDVVIKMILETVHLNTSSHLGFRDLEMLLDNSLGFSQYCQIHGGEFPKARFFLPVWLVSSMDASRATGCSSTRV